MEGGRKASSAEPAGETVDVAVNCESELGAAVSGGGDGKGAAAGGGPSRGAAVEDETTLAKEDSCADGWAAMDSFSGDSMSTKSLKRSFSARTCRSWCRRDLRDGPPEGAGRSS